MIVYAQRACEIKAQAAPGEFPMEAISDRGSNPLVSTKKERRYGYNRSGVYLCPADFSSTLLDLLAENSSIKSTIVFQIGNR